MSEMSERTGLLVGEEGIRRLSEASVILAGVGAVGGYALEGLVRALRSVKLRSWSYKS